MVLIVWRQFSNVLYDLQKKAKDFFCQLFVFQSSLSLFPVFGYVPFCANYLFIDYQCVREVLFVIAQEQK